MYESVVQIYFSTLAQVWAALVVFGAISLQESVRFQRDRMELYFQHCVSELSIFRDHFKKHKVKEAAKIFENQVEMASFLGRPDLEELFDRILLSEEAKLSKNDADHAHRIAQAQAYRASYLAHRDQSELGSHNLRRLFLQGAALIGVSLISLSLSQILGEHGTWLVVLVVATLGWSTLMVFQMLPEVL